MTPITIRLFLSSAIMLGIYGGVRWVHNRGMPDETAPLQMTADDLPKTLGEWRGESVALDPNIFQQIGAETVVNRQYRGAGHIASLHFAVFEKTDNATGLCHSPEICYPASGWTTGDPKYVSLDDGGAGHNMARFEQVTQHGETAYLLYWYQIDGKAYCTGDAQREILLACRGRSVRPPIVKVMLQTSAANAEIAEKALLSLGGEAFKWTRGFH